MTIAQYLEPPYGPDEIARWTIFQFQLVIGDLVMVCLLSSSPCLTLLTTRRQIYRMYHIYNRSFLACIIPSITTSGLIGDCPYQTYRLEF